MYLHIGENGGRSDVRWAAMINPSTKTGLLVRGKNGATGEEDGDLSTFQLNVSMHSVAELEKATHTNEVNEWEDGKFLVCLYQHDLHRSTFPAAHVSTLCVSLCLVTHTYIRSQELARTCRSRAHGCRRRQYLGA